MSANKVTSPDRSSTIPISTNQKDNTIISFMLSSIEPNIRTTLLHLQSTRLIRNVCNIFLSGMRISHGYIMFVSSASILSKAVKFWQNIRACLV